jgi:hypothetical protein
MDVGLTWMFTYLGWLLVCLQYMTRETSPILSDQVLVHLVTEDCGFDADMLYWLPSELDPAVFAVFFTMAMRFSNHKYFEMVRNLEHILGFL